METVREEARSIPVAGEFDICVVGGSCTGVFAAVRAAQLGAKVAIVEANGFFGGVATASFVNVWHSFYDITGRQQIIGGLTVEVVERLAKHDAIHLYPPTDPDFYVIMATADLILELDKLVVAAGVRPFLHTWFAAPLTQDGKLAAVAIEDKSGRRAIKASYFIDATGDGDLVRRLGLPCYRRPAVQPPTTCAIIHGLSEIKKERPDFSLKQAVFDPRRKNAPREGDLWFAQVPGSPDDVMVAGARVSGADCSDADQLTQAEIEGRRQVGVICDILRESYLPAGLNPLAALPAWIGIRETWHSACLHRTTEREILTGERFTDAIGNGTYRVDVHNAHGGGVRFRYLDGREVFRSPTTGDKEVGRWAPEGQATATFYQIPYRSLVPQGANNVLVAGRCLDADEGAFGALRVMVNCNQTGEAAGVASYLALDSGTFVADVSASALRAAMSKLGAIII